MGMWLAVAGEAKHKQNYKTVVNIVAGIKANSLDRYLIVISSLWDCWYFW